MISAVWSWIFCSAFIWGRQQNRRTTWLSVMKQKAFLLCCLNVSLSDREKLKPEFQIPWRTCCRSIPICIQHSKRLSQVSLSLFDLSVQYLVTPNWILTLCSKVIQAEMPIILTKHPFQPSDQMFWPELSRSQIENQPLSNLYLKSSNIHRVSSLNVAISSEVENSTDINRTIADLMIQIELSFTQGLKISLYYFLFSSL